MSLDGTASGSLGIGRVSWKKTEPWETFMPKVEAWGSDKEPWRLYRLHRVIGFLASCGYLYKGIYRLFEHHNILDVTWKKKPTQSMKDSVEEIWQSCLCTPEGGHEVRHHFLTKEEVAKVEAHRKRKSNGHIGFLG